MNIRDSRNPSRSDPMWTALAHVMPRVGEDPLDGARGAFVHAVGPAPSSSEFEERLRSLVAGLGLQLIELDDLEEIGERRSKYELTDELRAMAAQSDATGEIKLGSFHTYEDVDDLM
jgi:hypothetical protein